MFGYNSGSVYSVVLTGTVKGKNYVGGICGYNTGSVYTCTTSVAVTGTGSYIGGAVGVNNKSVYRIKNTGSVTGSNSTFGLAVGGIVGINLSSGSVYDVLNSATVTAANYQWVGGLLGQNHGSLRNSVNFGTVSGAYYVGGMVGQNGGGNIRNGYSKAAVAGTGTYVGGVTGFDNGGTVYYTYYSNFTNYQAKDGNGTVQKGIGSGTLGSATDDSKDNSGRQKTMYFTDTSNSSSVTRSDITTNYGKLGSSVNVNGYTTQILLDALNYGQTYLAKADGKPSTSFRAWGASSSYYSTYPTIFYSGWTAGAGTDWTPFTGSGTSSSPYIISSAEQLINLAIDVNGGSKFKGIYFKLGANITLSGDFRAIGWYNSSSGEGNYFNGTFDGAGYSISGLTLTKSGNGVTDYVGLFGYLYSAAVVKNVNIVGTATGANYVGGVAGYNMGTISHVTFTGTVTGSGSYIGGLVGVNNGTIENSTHIGNVTGSNTTFGLALGGLVGINLSGGTIKNAHSNGLDGTSSPTNTVSGTNYQWVGGLVGQNHGAIYNSYNNKKVTGAYFVDTVVGGTIKVIISGTGNYNTNELSATTSTISAITLSWSTKPTVSSKAYNGNNAATIASHGEISGVVSDDTCTLDKSGASATFDNATAGSGKAITFTGYALDGKHKGNYILNQPTGVTGTITKVALTITADDKSMVYGTAAPTYTVKGAGFVNNETLAVIGGTPAFTIKNSSGSTISNVSTADVGTYTITPSGYTSNNYTITFTAGTLTICWTYP